jgi:hypothetical protein
MADSTAAAAPMTIDFLRARLLSERSVSRASKERADQLAARVRAQHTHTPAARPPCACALLQAAVLLIRALIWFRSRSWRSRSGR